MRAKILAVSVVVLLLVAGAGLYLYLRFWPGLRPALGPIPKSSVQKPARGTINTTGLPLTIPAGFRIDTFASGLGHARFMAVDPSGTLLVSATGDGKILALPDKNRDGKADRVVTLAEGLNLPHGLAFRQDMLYVAETDKVRRYSYDPEGPALGETVVLARLPSDGGHFTRTITFGPDDKMYVSVGSSSNIIEEPDPRRAAILRFDADGGDAEIFARGLRNAVGLVWHPVAHELWATDNGRDWLGDDLPPDEVDVVKAGGDYGFPYAYGDKVTDPEFDNASRAAATLPPKIEIPAHSAPLGLTFFTADSFGTDYKNDLFVCFHGSWNRSVPTGYKVVRYHLTGKTKEEVASASDFITGWLTPDGALGRPVDVIVGADSSLYISDDKAGVVYRVSK